jgi:hypothetical protein
MNDNASAARADAPTHTKVPIANLAHRDCNEKAALRLHCTINLHDGVTKAGRRIS